MCHRELGGHYSCGPISGVDADPGEVDGSRPRPVDILVLSLNTVGCVIDGSRCRGTIEKKYGKSKNERVGGVACPLEAWIESQNGIPSWN